MTQSKAVKQINVPELVSSWFSESNWDSLKLSSVSVLRELGLLIPREADIEQSRFFPMFYGDRLVRVHLLFITKKVLHHVFLGKGLLEYRQILIADMQVRLDFEYDYKGRLSVVSLRFDVGDRNPDGSPHLHYLKTDARMKKHAISLVKALNLFKSELK